MSKGYRIISIEACEIYKHEQEYGVAAGYKLPERKSDAYFWLFKNRLDDSLDTIELEKAYTRICRKKFAFQDSFGNNYTTAVVNLKFNYTYKPAEGKIISIKDLRKYYYENGFNMDGVHYVRYKRSAGSSRQGECLFIDERLYKSMSKWGECGLKQQDDVASWESYKALSLSSIKGTIDIPLNGILFVPDYKSTFTDNVVSVEVKDGALTAETKQTQITNDIWDGESLLDESLFSNDYADKHMLLLRNKFFKSCAFRTKLQKWFKDKNITIADLKQRGFITLADDINQIVIVSTPNSLKYLKFAGELNEKNIRKWTKNVDSTFGVVKWDKYTRFFHGDMVQSSYQLLNTLGLTEEQVVDLLQPSIEYIWRVRNDIDFTRFHFTEAFAGDRSDNDGDSDKPDGLADRASVIFALMLKCDGFEQTELYLNFVYDVVKSLKRRLKRGHILLNGTNATLFGNGPELLKYLAGEEITSELKPAQIRCERFDDGVNLLCARSPHITMGNLYCVENNLGGDIWNYFDLGENIVCVNAIGENIQQRLNGCDYDSDSVLVTDDEMLVEAAKKYNTFFKVPVCNIQPSGKAETTLPETDHKISVNKIGEIVNLSQKLNSLIWDKLNNNASVEEIMPVYQDVCKLAVLSGIEIDKAKRAFNNISVGSELYKIRTKYDMANPMFFKDIDDGRSNKKYTYYNTTMDYIVKYMKKVHFRDGRYMSIQKIPISMLMAYVDDKGTSSDYRHKDKVVAICTEYSEKINKMYQAIRTADSQERAVLYETITQLKVERDKKVAKQITNDTVLKLVIKHYEKNKASDWRLYAALINNPAFADDVYKTFKNIYTRVVECEDGEYTVYGRKFTKIP